MAARFERHLTHMLKLTRRHKSPYWYIRGTLRGSYVEQSTQTTDKDTAEALRITMEGNILNRVAKMTDATFTTGAINYLQRVGDDKLVPALMKYFDDWLLRDIDQIAVEDAAADLFPRGGPATRQRNVFTPVSAIINHCAKRGMCPPLKLIRPKGPKGRVRWLTPVEAERLIDACAPHMRPLVVFLLYTGARLSEALYLDWKDVDLDASRVVFRDTKNGEDRGVPLHERVRAVLARFLGRTHEGAVFLTHKGKPYARRKGGGGQIDTAFKNACRRAGIEDFSPHDCRHTWATWLYSETGNLGDLMKLGGWKSEAMVHRYAHGNPDHLKRSIDTLPWSPMSRADDEKLYYDAAAPGKTAHIIEFAQGKIERKA